MTVNSVFLINALLRHNYFPAQRKQREEIPPCLTSKTFSPGAARDLLACELRGGTQQGYDLVEYRSTRFNAISRTLAIPHPLPYAHLVQKIHDSWANIDHICSSDVSMIHPRQHRDERIIVMDYEGFRERGQRARDMAFGRRFIVRTDVASCFPSIYSHAIPWAAVGIAEAKRRRGRAEWFNELDYHQRMVQRGETQGVPVGPATSNIIAELILQKVDGIVSRKFNFVRQADGCEMARFIDDYTYYCDSHSEGEQFLQYLDEQLTLFKLRLNPRKTAIRESVAPFYDPWALELASRVPTSEEINHYQAITYLDFAANLAKLHPEGSVLKYATNALLGQSLNRNAQSVALDYLLVLSFHNPILLPSLDTLLDTVKSSTGDMRVSERLVKILTNNARLRRSDGMAWGLYYVAKHNVPIPEELVNSVLDTGDCVAILLLYLTGQHTERISEWVRVLDKSDVYGLDRYWLLLYQLYFDDRIGSDFGSDPMVFEILKGWGVSFVDRSLMPPESEAVAA